MSPALRLGFRWLAIPLVVVVLSGCGGSNAEDRALDRMEDALRPHLGEPKRRGGEGPDGSLDALRYYLAGSDAEIAVKVISYLTEAGLHPEPCSASPPDWQRLCLLQDFWPQLLVRVEFRINRDTNISVMSERRCHSIGGHIRTPFVGRCPN